MADHVTNALSALQRDRAEAELRRGQGLLLMHEARPVYYLFPVEFLDHEQWQHYRTQSPLLVDSQGEMPVANAPIQALAELCYSSERPASAHSVPASQALIKLVKQAGVLPIVLALPAHLAPAFTQTIRVEDLHAPLTVEIVAGETVQLPIAGLVHTTLTSFRTRYGASVHLALCAGDWKKSASPLVRIHSSCVTGDILGSLRCDCGDQLQMALTRIKQEGTGILLYLHQEGRGIGISSKLRSYQLQEHGIDTYDANRHLGYAEDERDFSISHAILTALGVSKLRLLTNNPDKIAALESAGITITERIPLIAESGPHNKPYLTAKAKKQGF